MDNALSARAATRCAELSPLPETATPSLAGILSGCRRVLCAINPDDAGRRIVQRVVALLDGRDVRLGVVSAASFELPFEGVASLYPTPLDRRARLIVERQRALDALVAGLGLRDIEIFATAGVPKREIADLAALWRADLLLFARAAGTGLRQRRLAACTVVALDDKGDVAAGSLIERWLGR
jgi:nucleotide-binding universal stress UspA family protein